MYDGSALAKRGDIVVVTINYRLGCFGYLHFPGKTLSAGSLDQVEALKWVNKNIALFGGDPNNITIFGESAGAYSVLSLCSIALPEAYRPSRVIARREYIRVSEARQPKTHLWDRFLFRSVERNAKTDPRLEA